MRGICVSEIKEIVKENQPPLYLNLRKSGNYILEYKKNGTVVETQMIPYYKGTKDQIAVENITYFCDKLKKVLENSELKELKKIFSVL